jgi:hypothetical protein
MHFTTMGMGRGFLLILNREHQMENQYWIQREGKTSGPFSGQQLKQMAAAGMILTADMISTNQINWQVAGQVKGLFGDRKPTPPPVPIAAMKSSTNSQSGRNCNPAVSMETDSGRGTVHFRCQHCDKPIRVEAKWIGKRFKCPSCGYTDKILGSGYDQMPFYKKQGFFWLTYFLLTPVALTILLFGDVYYERNGKLKSFGLANKIIAGVLGLVYLVRILVEFTK